jgi:hypothetical protein
MLSVAQIAAIPAANFAGLSTDQIAAFTTTQMAVITAAQLQALTPAKLAAFTKTQLAAMGSSILSNLSGFSSAQLAAFLGNLNATQLAWIAKNNPAFYSANRSLFDPVASAQYDIANGIHRAVAGYYYDPNTGKLIPKFDNLSPSASVAYSTAQGVDK